MSYAIPGLLTPQQQMLFNVLTHLVIHHIHHLFNCWSCILVKIFFWPLIIQTLEASTRCQAYSLIDKIILVLLVIY